MNMGLVVFRTLSTIAGGVFIYGAICAILEGSFKSPKEVVHGDYIGVTHIRRSDRPVAFWFCTSAYVVFGAAIIFCAWFVI
jgi:hypothetical protein